MLSGAPLLLAVLASASDSNSLVADTRAQITSMGYGAQPKFATKVGSGAGNRCPGYGSYGAPLRCPDTVVDPPTCNSWCKAKCKTQVSVYGMANPGGVCQCQYGDNNPNLQYWDQVGVCTFPSFIQGLGGTCYKELQENTLENPTATKRAARANVTRIAAYHDGVCDYECMNQYNTAKQCHCTGQMNYTFEKACSADFPNGGKACVLDLNGGTGDNAWIITNAFW